MKFLPLTLLVFSFEICFQG